VVNRGFKLQVGQTKDCLLVCGKSWVQAPGVLTLSRVATNTSFTVLGLTHLELEPTIYHTWGDNLWFDPPGAWTHDLPHTRRQSRWVKPKIVSSCVVNLGFKLQVGQTKDCLLVCGKSWVQAPGGSNQWLATGRWVSLVSSNNKTDRHDITAILLKVALKTHNPNP
jgi:hypothetical protein